MFNSIKYLSITDPHIDIVDICLPYCFRNNKTKCMSRLEKNFGIKSPPLIESRIKMKDGRSLPLVQPLIFNNSVLLYMRSPRVGYCSISDDLSYS